MTSDTAGSKARTTNPVAGEHPLAGAVLSAVAATFHTAGDNLDMATLAEVVGGALALAGNDSRTVVELEAELEATVAALIERELLEVREGDVLLGAAAFRGDE